MNQIEFEKLLMEKLLAGDDPVLGGLRDQFQNSIIESRKFTGAGFFSYFNVNIGIGPVADGKTFQIGGVHASFNQIKEAFGFVLFVKHGYLSMLEGYTLTSENWPSEYSNVILKYNGSKEKRDLDELRAKWS
jgi:hypothetical protein